MFRHIQINLISIKDVNIPILERVKRLNSICSNYRLQSSTPVNWLIKLLNIKGLFILYEFTLLNYIGLYII